VRTKKSKSTTQTIIDTVYSYGCIKREDLINLIKVLTQEEGKKLEDRITKALSRLVKKGVIKRVGYAIYCKP
jgi:uncharacterized linocin/CFP29 family protein